VTVNDMTTGGPAGSQGPRAGGSAADRSEEPRAGVWRGWHALPLLLVPFLFLHLGVPLDPPDEAAAEARTGVVTEGNILPLRVNEHVLTWMHRFRTDQREEFQEVLQRRGAFEGLIRQRLRDRGMPEDLLYLAMMESGLKPRAESSASAVGLWQFMVSTAQQYGLRVDEWVDERRDPVRATNAALDYLRWLHDRYGSWYLAAAAYNAGPGRVDRVIAQHAGTDARGEDLYWAVVDHLPRETREYVPRLVAASLLAQDADAAGSTSGARPYRFDRVFVPGATSLARVARILGVGEQVLRALNPHLIQAVTPPNETYPIRVPVGSAGRVVAVLGRGRPIRRAD
jgi:peptidoglycan lytic transglycosylase D